MKRFLKTIAVVAFTVCIAFAALASAKTEEKSPLSKNPFEGKVVQVSSPNVEPVVIINPRIVSVFGRPTIVGDEIGILRHGFSNGRTYKKSGATTYVSWDQATVCLALDAAEFHLSPDPWPTER